MSLTTTMTYTRTVQLSEDEENLKLSELDIRRMSQRLDDMIMREILGTSSEFAESLRAAKARI